MRRARNRISGIKTVSGDWTEREEEIQNTVVAYFQDLFTSTIQVGSPTEVFGDLRVWVSAEMNASLMSEINAEEVKKAVFSINPEKAPGPDGMTALFFQKFWHVVGDDVVKMVSNFFLTGELDDRINELNICLIPKSERPKEMKEFRPISLCNVGYKIISKVMCQRLRPILPGLISETQSAFVAGRAITDNVLIAQEVFHALNTKPSCRDNFMAVKTDMSKAYDRVEWNFLETLLTWMGFVESWISRVMTCVNSVTYSVLLNGSPRGRIVPSRGLRQGDPLSPYLFILCTEVLISQIRRAEEDQRLTGIKVAYRSPQVSHLLFADDSLFMCRADGDQCRTLKQILVSYEKASGQCVNFEKSAITFGKNINQELRRQMKDILGIRSEGGMGKYLGIPEQLQGSKQQIFAYVRDRLHQRINGWNAKFLTKGGKEIMIKSVAQAIPTYVMSCFLLPKRLCDQLTSAVAEFWWQTNGSSRGIHWMSSKKMCIPKEDGGVGFKSFADFNKALLAKQLWRLHRFPNSLAARVLKGRYFRNIHPFHARKPNRPSYGWRSIWSSRDLINAGVRKTINSGEQSRVWQDNWLPNRDPQPASGPGSYYYPDLRVSDMRVNGQQEWNVPLLRQMVCQEDFSLVMSLAPPARVREDSFCWHYTKSGNYTVKSGYQVLYLNKNDEEIEALLQEPSFTALKRFVWKLRSPNKLKHILWQALAGNHPVKESLMFRHMEREGDCPRCGQLETINHMLFKCPRAVQIWALAGVPYGHNRFPTDSLRVNLDFLFSRWRDPDARIPAYPWFAWYIWKARNDKLFRNIDRDPMDTKDLAVGESIAWGTAQELRAAQMPEIEAEGVENLSLTHGSGEELSCFTDGSWKEGDETKGVGWVLQRGDGRTELIGLKRAIRSLSPLHAELLGLFFAMECLHRYGTVCQIFYTDCRDLLRMVETPEEWPTFTSELDTLRDLQQFFPGFSLRFAARERNKKADLLARNARGRKDVFQFTGPLLPFWFSDTCNVFERQ